MVAAAKSCLLKVRTIPVGERMADYPPIGTNVETDWRCRMI
jgi:hypothetical protein